VLRTPDRAECPDRFLNIYATCDHPGQGHSLFSSGGGLVFGLFGLIPLLIIRRKTKQPEGLTSGFEPA
jgi:hypothetical protein